MDPVLLLYQLILDNCSLPLHSTDSKTGKKNNGICCSFLHLRIHSCYKFMPIKKIRLVLHLPLTAHLILRSHLKAALVVHGSIQLFLDCCEHHSLCPLMLRHCSSSLRRCTYHVVWICPLHTI